MDRTNILMNSKMHLKAFLIFVLKDAFYFSIGSSEGLNVSKDLVPKYYIPLGFF
jgi:hypothetical protein